VDNLVTQQFVNALWDTSIIPTLSHYITIPNKSPMFDSDWEKNGYMDEAMALMTAWCQNHAPKDMKLELLRSPGRTPLIYIEIPETGDKKEKDTTVLFYGHMDKQPEMTGWNPGLEPWKPVMSGDKLYGRGGADDGYAIFSALTAILALQEQNIPHARCVIIIEASEESGSNDLPFYLDLLDSRIGIPSLIICLDSGAGNYEQMWITTSLRGNFSGSLNASLLNEGIHSGHGSGVVSDSFRVLKHLISQIEDEVTGEILLKSLQSNIPQDRIEQAKYCAEVLGDEIITSLPLQEGVVTVSSDLEELVLNKTWRAALSVTGVAGLPELASAGNVSRPFTALKLSMRTPPNCDAEKAVEEMVELFAKNVLYNAKISYQPDSKASSGWNAPPTESWLENACKDASTLFFGKPAVWVGEGGSIPFIGMMGKKFPDSQFVITGVLGPASNAHGPNEFLHIPTAKKLTACIAMILEKQFNQ
jgi:acetylornithine deacetylase/succinyl-diaminopimelate desuccinylase-like protein